MKIDMDLNEKEFVEKYVREDSMFYRFLKGVLRIITNILYRPKFYGKENIPAEGGVLLAGNHRAMIDPVFVCLGTKRTVHYISKKVVMESFIGRIIYWAGAIPTDPDSKNKNSYHAVQKTLNMGKAVGIFPEGQRNKSDEVLMPFRYGAVRLAQTTGAAIVPLAITGGFKPFINPIKVYYGEPYTISADSDTEEENQLLRQKIADLYLAHQ